MAERLEVLVEGELLEGWEELRISRSVEEFAGSFTLLLAEVAPGDPRGRKLLRGQAVRLLIDGELVFAGDISRRVKAYNGTTNAITVTGRDIVADLIDCSAANEPGQWTGAKIATIAGELLEPFPRLRFREDLSASSLGSGDLALETSESVYAALDRLARMRGLLVTSDLEGGVYFSKPGVALAPVALERGVNVEQGSIEEDESGRFSRYIIHGAGPTPAYWDVGVGPGQHFRVETTDPGVQRYRPIVLHAESKAGEPELKLRCAWEAKVRAARAERVTYVLPDWTLDGHLWQPGERVPVYDPILEIGGPDGAPVEMLVGSVDWSRSATGGSRTTLGIYRPGAFDAEPPKPPKKNKAQELWLE